MKYIPLTQGRFAIVDEEDFEELSRHKWCVNGKGYATRKIDGRVVTMHRIILSCPTGKQVDHANLNRLDNRRSNIRIATRSQNIQNTIARANKAVGLKGVSFDHNNYRARITVNKRTIYLGYFPSPEKAHEAYASAARLYFGEFSRT